jgi:hypothetical protein
MKRLPTFEGYTVDARLEEFRKVEYGKRPEFVPFESKKGQALLQKYLSTGKAEIWNS